MTTTDTASATSVGGRPGNPGPAQGSTHRAIPLGRIVTTELRKMFDTRSGFWLVASIGILALLATTAVIAFSSDASLTYNTFARAVAYPTTVVLPVIAILSVTSEWSQRSGLTTFTLVPHRERIVVAKAIASIGIAVATIPIALAIGALGNLAGATFAGVDPVWDVTVTNLLTLVLANVLGLLAGFMLGVLIRNSAGALVAYFVYAFLLPTLSIILANTQEWFRHLQPWIDFQYAGGTLIDGSVTSEQWAHLGTSAVLWLVIPLVIGLRLVMKAEVK